MILYIYTHTCVYIERVIVIYYISALYICKYMQTHTYHAITQNSYLIYIFYSGIYANLVVKCINLQKTLWEFINFESI